MINNKAKMKHLKFDFLNELKGITIDCQFMLTRNKHSYKKGTGYLKNKKVHLKLTFSFRP